MPLRFGVSVAKHVQLILRSLNSLIHCIVLKKQFDVFIGKNLRLESKLTKRLSSVRLLACFGVVRFSSRSERVC